MSNEENKNNRIYNKKVVDEVNKIFEGSLENVLLGNHDVFDMTDIVKAKTDPAARQRIIDLVNRVRERVINSTQNKEFGIKEGRERPVLNADLFLSEISSEFENAGLPRLVGVPTPPPGYPRVDRDPVTGETSINFGEVDLLRKDKLPDPGVFNPFEELPTLHYRKLDLSDLSDVTRGKLESIGADFDPAGPWGSMAAKGFTGSHDGDTPTPYMFYNLVDNHYLTHYPIPRALIIVVFDRPQDYNPEKWTNCKNRLPSRTKFRKLSGRRKRLVAKMIEYGERRSELGMVKEYELSRK